MRKTLFIAGTLLVAILLVLGACAPATTPPPEETPAPIAPKTSAISKLKLDNWLISLNKVSWQGVTVDADLSITNIGTRPACFPLAEQSTNLLGGYSTFDFYVVDSYNLPYFDVLAPSGRYSKDVYPSETADMHLQFTVNEKSGEVALYLSVQYKGDIKLFNLGTPK